MHQFLSEQRFIFHYRVSRAYACWSVGLGVPEYDAGEELWQCVDDDLA
jgi:hypothetical protein